MKPIFPFFFFLFCFSSFPNSGILTGVSLGWRPRKELTGSPDFHPDCGRAAESRQEDTPVFSSSLVQGVAGHRLCAEIPEVSAGSQEAVTSQATESPFCSTSYYGHKSIYHPVSRELVPIHLWGRRREEIKLWYNIDKKMSKVGGVFKANVLKMKGDISK